MSIDSGGVMKHSSKTKARNKDTSVSLHPMPFNEAIAALANSPKQTDSQVAECDSTKEADPVSETSKKRTAQRRKSSAG